MGTKRWRVKGISQEQMEVEEGKRGIWGSGRCWEGGGGLGEVFFPASVSLPNLLPSALRAMEGKKKIKFASNLGAARVARPGRKKGGREGSLSSILQTGKLSHGALCHRDQPPVPPS